MPEVSVIIPAYNAARYLPAAVDSVLAQTVRDFEILVVDDGSTDTTPAVMAGYGPPVRYFRQPNGGVSVARNRGIAESRGRYIAFLDADDTWSPEKLARQLAALREHSEWRACCSAFVVVDSELAPLAVRRSPTAEVALVDLLTRGNVVGSISTVLCEYSLLEATGGFDVTLSQCADWDMCIRLAVHTRIGCVDEPLASYRQHGANMSRSIALLEHDSLRVLEKGFALPGLPAPLRARRQKAMARNYMVLAGSYFQAGCLRDFVRCAARSLLLDWGQAGYLLTFPARRLSRLRCWNPQAAR